MRTQKELDLRQETSVNGGELVVANLNAADLKNLSDQQLQNRIDLLNQQIANTTDPAELARLNTLLDATQKELDLRQETSVNGGELVVANLNAADLKNLSDQQLQNRIDLLNQQIANTTDPAELARLNALLDATQKELDLRQDTRLMVAN